MICKQGSIDRIGEYQRESIVNVVKISDGLGNQMFQYAFARMLKIKTRKSVYLDTRFINHDFNESGGKWNSFYKKCDYRKYGLNHFKITLPEADETILWKWKYRQCSNEMEKLLFLLSKYHMWPWQYKIENNEKHTQSFLRYSFCPTYYDGYFFDLSFFDDIKCILQKEFHVKKPVILPTQLRKILIMNNTVSIHVRRGDFTKLSRDISGTDYYCNAIQKIEEQIETPIYLIFSDDIRWVRENMQINGEKIYISEMGFLDYEEMTIMKHCKHNIIANSTFSYWAAYLNDNPDKIVICPKRWKSRTIPNDWICI